MSKEMVESVQVTNEVVDKFHRALCPKCNGRCRRFGAVCEYDYEHKKGPEPGINTHWQNYVVALQEEARKLDMTLDEAYELLTMWNVPEDKRIVAHKLQDLFDEIE